MNILIVAKRSKYEWEKLKFNLKDSEILAKYADEQANSVAIINAHNQHVKIRESLMKALPDADMLMMSDLDSEIKDYDLVLSLGGDNSFTYISHYVGEASILGINSDPYRSAGCLTQYSANSEQDIYKLAEILKFQYLEIQQWARIGAKINGHKLPLATSEIYVGECKRNYMSRHILEYEGEVYEQKCSGLIAATGAGSTGWFKSISKQQPWGKTDKKFKFVVSEPYNKGAKANHTGILPGIYDKSIKIHSLNDDKGIVNIDSWEEYDFPRGATAEIFLEKPLSVAYPLYNAEIEHI